MHHWSSIGMLIAAAAMAGISGSGARTAPAQTARAQTAQTAPLRVTIRFMCSGERSVNPWEARIASGRDVEWVLDTVSDVDQFRIRRKQANGAWPFEGAVPHTGTKATPARGRGKQTPRGTYAYDIEAACRAPGGGVVWKKIDPDIIIVEI